MEPVGWLDNGGDKRVGFVDEGASYVRPSVSSVYGDDTSLDMGSIEVKVPSGSINERTRLRGTPHITGMTAPFGPLSFQINDISEGSRLTTISGPVNPSLTTASRLLSVATLVYAQVVSHFSGTSTVNIRAVQGSSTVIASSIRITDASDFNAKFPVGTRFGLGTGPMSVLEAIGVFAQATGVVVRHNEASSFETDFTPLVNFGELTKNSQVSVLTDRVEVNWYEGGRRDETEMFPLDTDPRPSPLTVDASATEVFDIPINGWVVTVNQPQAVDWVEADPHHYDGTNGVYSIAGNDGRPVTAAQWLGQGGSVSVDRHPTDPKQIRVTVRGASEPRLAPYSLAMTSGELYNSLRVTGDFVLGNPRTLRIPTGSSPSLLTGAEEPIVIDNPAVQTLDQAYQLGTRAAEQYVGWVNSLTVSDQTTAQPGDLVRHRDLPYRVRTENGGFRGPTNITAEQYSSMALFEEVWGDATMAEFEDEWGLNTFGMMEEFMNAYLRKSVE